VAYDRNGTLRAIGFIGDIERLATISTFAASHRTGHARQILRGPVTPPCEQARETNRQSSPANSAEDH